jgi:hypothetical protein
LKIRGLDETRYTEIEQADLWGKTVLLITNKSLEHELTIPIQLSQENIEKLIDYLQKEKEKLK